MNFLSRIHVDHRTVAQKQLRDSYAWHQTIWQAFPESESRDFLYRVQSCESGFLLYLLSEKKPNLPSWGKWETKRIGKSFLEHSAYRFQLCANPTVKRKREGRKNGTRTAIYDPQKLEEWLRRKAKQGGFSVDKDSLQIGPPLNQPFYKKGRRGNHKRVEFQGILRVKNPEKFKKTFKKGIGSAKAFGFGLLVLQPIN